MASMEEKVAIVTGAANGIGLATAKALLNAGAYVLGVDIALAPTITHARFYFLQQDLTATSAPSTIVSCCLEKFNGRIDALINNAGISDAFASVETIDDQDWDKVMTVNLTAPVRLTKAVVPVMKKQRSGSIVNVSSKAGISGAIAGLAYTTSKHALIGVTKNTAWMMKDEGIRCNAICPGAIATAMAAEVQRFDAETFGKAKQVLDIHVDLKNPDDWESPDAPANLMVFLASDLSRGINGAIIPIDRAFSCI